MSTLKKILAVNSEEGKSLNIAGGDYRIVISGEQTNGEFAVIEMTIPVGAGPPPHEHEHIDESFYVLEGEVSFHSENGSYLAKKGAFVNIPKGGMIHCFKNQSSQPAKLLCTVIPAGLDECFVETSNFIAGHPDISEEERKTGIMNIAEKYGNNIYPPNYFKEIRSKS